MLPALNPCDRPWISRYPRDVPVELHYPTGPISRLLEEAAHRVPGRIACRHHRQELTYAELLIRSRKFASVLIERGLQSGDRVGLLMPNMPEYLVALFGTWMAGGVSVPLNPLMVAEEIGDIISSTGCRFVVALDLLLPLLPSEGLAGPQAVFVTSLTDKLPWWSRQLYRVARLAKSRSRSRTFPVVSFDRVLNAVSMRELDSVSGDSPANILPTGGTTGHPKAVVLTHRNMLSNAWQLYHWTGQRFGKDVVLAVLPLFHSYGLTTCGLSGIAMGATVVLHHRFRADAVLRLIERQRPTLIPAVPAMLAAFNKELRRKRYDLRGVRACISGGAPLPPTVAAEFSEHTGAAVVEGYGLSEASPVTHAGPLDGTARPGTIGIPMPDTDALIVDPVNGEDVLPPGEVGELVVRGPQVMAGYWNDPEATNRALRDGWLFTGDLAMCDGDGFFRIVDRKKDLIITSGVNVYPTDVEHVLRNFDGIEDVVVLGVPDLDRGELVKAVVVPKPGIPFNQRAFEDFAKQHLEVHRRPRIVEVATGPLPRTPLGKVLRRALRVPEPKDP